MISLELTVGSRDVPITYVITGVINHEDLGRMSSKNHVKLTTELISSSATHYGNLFRSDNELVFTKLEQEIKNTAGWNHINTFKGTKD